MGFKSTIRRIIMGAITKIIQKQIAIALLICGMVTLAWANADDDAKLEQARDKLKAFKEQSVSVDREKLSRKSYMSLYKSNIQYALLGVLELLKNSGYDKKVDQYKNYFRMDYKKKNQLSEEKDQKIDQWASDLFERCKTKETDLLDFINTGLNSCKSAIEKYAVQNPLPMDQNLDIREEMNAYLTMNKNYIEFKEKRDQIQKYYPDIFVKITSELNLWTGTGRRKNELKGLPPMGG
jgi:hypothetical protein